MKKAVKMKQLQSTFGLNHVSGIIWHCVFDFSFILHSNISVKRQDLDLLEWEKKREQKRGVIL